MYAQQKRRQLQRENPDVPNSDISRLLGELWRGTGAAEKRPFLEREEAERRMYKAKMEKWKNDQKLEKSMKSVSSAGSGGKMPDRRQDVASCAREETHPRYGEERSQDVSVPTASFLNFPYHILCLPQCAVGPSEQGTNLTAYPTRSASMHHPHQNQERHADNETDATLAYHQYNYDVGSWTPTYNREEARIKYTYPRPREDQPQP